MPAQERPRKYSSDLSTSSPNFFRGPVADLGPFTPTEGLSSLESDDNYVPVPLQLPLIPYEPIQIPREPTLEDILNDASGPDQELSQVKHLKLTVISENLSLQRIAVYCPLLTSLNLDGSALNTLRDLGCTLVNLRFLDISRCGLRSLDGTSGLGSLTHLIANYNQIEFLDPCSFLDELQELCVLGNRIRSTNNLLCLAQLPLRVLHLSGNPIEELENFQELAKNAIPNLKLVNGVRVREEDEEFTGRCREDSLSSFHTESSSGSFSSFEPSPFRRAPPAISHNGSTVATSSDYPQNRNATNNGQSSVTDTGSFPLSQQRSRRTADRPLSAGLLRLREKHRWSVCSSPDTTDSLPDIDELELLDKQFPLSLPQSTPPIALELGVIGTILETSVSVSGTGDLLRLANQWRQFRQASLAAVGGVAEGAGRNLAKRPESAKGRLVGCDVTRRPMTKGGQPQQQQQPRQQQSPHASTTH